MRIAVLGAGAIGAYVGAALTRGGADGSLTLHRSAWSAEILKDAALAVADLEDEEEAKAFAAAAHAAGVPARVADCEDRGADRH